MPELLPISSRVTYFDGGVGTHGRGTIVAYNKTKPMSDYTRNHLVEAAEIAAVIGSLSSLAESAYDSSRYPYLVKWDKSDKFPDGYTDVYGPNEINLICGEVDDKSNVT